MPNHVHLILTPADEPGLARAAGEAHRRYATFVGARGRWTGHLFQARFTSVAMDEDHLMAARRVKVERRDARASRGERLVEGLDGAGDFGMSTDAVLALMRGPSAADELEGPEGSWSIPM